MTEREIVNIIRTSVQSNFQNNEYANSNQKTGRNLRKGEQRNLDGSEGNTTGSGENQNQAKFGIQTQDGSGRVLSGNGTGIDKTVPANLYFEEVSVITKAERKSGSKPCGH